MAPGGSRFYDATLDGEPIEIKNPLRGATSSTMLNRANESKRNQGQSRFLVFDLRSTGMTEDEARRGIRRIRGAYLMYFNKIRIIGDNYDHTERF